MIGRGIGWRMFQHAAERAQAVGARWLVWSTDTNALGFYSGWVVRSPAPRRRASPARSRSPACGWISGRRDARRGEYRAMGCGPATWLAALRSPSRGFVRAQQGPGRRPPRRSRWPRR
jgi:hypothetical protein